MQAGRQKGALPLIRKFNEHSERLLRSALCVCRFSHDVDPDVAKFNVLRGDLPPAKRQRTDEV